MSALGSWKVGPRSLGLSVDGFQHLPGWVLGEAEVSSLEAILDLSQMFLLALPELTVPFPCFPTKSTGSFLARRHQEFQGNRGQAQLMMEMSF